MRVGALKKLTMVILLALWVPVTSHCVLVALSGLEEFACCDHSEEESLPAHEDECATDACSILESGFYKTEVEAVATPARVLNLIVFEIPEPLPHPTLGAASCRSADPPADLIPTVSFRTRTALPARAPDSLA